MGSLWNRSGTVERYGDDIRASGAKAYFFQGGTTTPLTVFQDAIESAAHAHPVVADANGRWPDIFVPYTTAYDVRVTSSFDSQLTFTTRIPNPNPVDTTVIVPPENQVQTGMVHAEFVNTIKPGYVRLNGSTIGNASSGGTERANADTSALFIYLWNNLNNTVCPVSGGRGASGAADFSANKNIGLPDMRGTFMQGLDDMGGAAAGRFTGLTFNSGDGITAGSSIGANSVVLSSTQMPTHFHTGTTDQSGTHTHTVSGTTGTDGVASLSLGTESALHQHEIPPLVLSSRSDMAAGGGITVVTNAVFGTLTGTGAFSNFENVNHTHSPVPGSANHSHSFSFTTNSTGTSHTHGFTTSTVGGTTPINNLPLTRLVTWFIKL